jgi:hypothetical protein
MAARVAELAAMPGPDLHDSTAELDRLTGDLDAIRTALAEAEQVTQRNSTTNRAGSRSTAVNMRNDENPLGVLFELPGQNFLFKAHGHRPEIVSCIYGEPKTDMILSTNPGGSRP